LTYSLPSWYIICATTRLQSCSGFLLNSIKVLNCQSESVLNWVSTAICRLNFSVSCSLKTLTIATRVSVPSVAERYLQSVEKKVPLWSRFTKAYEPVDLSGWSYLVKAEKPRKEISLTSVGKKKISNSRLKVNAGKARVTSSFSLLSRV